MITEDYVSFEIAKLLKEKGFNESCTHVCNIKSGKILEAAFYTCKYVYNSWLDKNEPRLIACPTLQMAMMWLREMHNIIPIILTGGHNQNPFYYWFRIDTAKEGVWKDAIYRENEKEFPTYEQAAEAAIKYCLENLI